jgi:hypothetical protein
MNTVPTINPDLLPEESPQTKRSDDADMPPPSLSAADRIMQLQRGFRRRPVQISYMPNGGPIVTHHGPHPNGKQVRKARAAARRAKLAAEEATRQTISIVNGMLAIDGGEAIPIVDGSLRIGPPPAP